MRGGFPGIQPTLDRLTRRLLDERTPAGHWEGELAESALSTATAAIALTLAGRHAGEETGERLFRLANGGAAWLAAHQNGDGGWGDTVLSLSNISTTSLCWAALRVVGRKRPENGRASGLAEAWLRREAGGIEPGRLAEAISRRYGEDRTFSVPILTVLALSGLLGEEREAWRRVPQLPFELALLPQSWYRWARLPVVSYALPALIAIGQARHRQNAGGNPLLHWLRGRAVEPTLAILERIQPSSGGFLEATPLTSFVTMSLITAGQPGHAVVSKGVEFLERSARPSGSWPIDTNLATWVTTLSINALAHHPQLDSLLTAEERQRVREWLLGQQFRERHPYTGAPPGGWAWTDLPGGVPDADDTPGALLALRALGPADADARRAAAAGVGWLLGLQNSDGGMPTFCRGWGKLPFDRSSPDLTIHAVRAWEAWRADLPPRLGAKAGDAIRRALAYLERTQRPDGAWQPLWFGNQFAPDHANLTYGTARVLQGLAETPTGVAVVETARRAAQWLVNAQVEDGGWGGAEGVQPSIEETALATAALAVFLRSGNAVDPDGIAAAVARGVGWLIEHTKEGTSDEPAPIGFYFASLWYYEKLYPRIFTLEALARVNAAFDEAERE